MKYQYRLKILAKSPVLRTAPMDKLPGCAEMVVISKMLDSYAECESKLDSLLAKLALIESSATRKNYVILSRTNPSVSHTPEMDIDDDEPWESSTMFKSFLVDVASVAAAIPSFSISARLDVIFDEPGAKTSP